MSLIDTIKAKSILGLINRRDLQRFTPVAIPSGLGWDMAAFPVSIALIDDGFGHSRGQVSGVNPAALMAAAYAGPDYYVNNAGGSNTNTGLSWAQAFSSIDKGMSTLNTLGVPGKVHVRGGMYPRGQTFANGPTYPAVDIVFIADTGRVTCTTADNLTWTADPIYPNTSKATRSQVARVVDLLGRNEFGHYTDFVAASSYAACGATPGTWWTDGTSVWVNRADGRLAMDANTRAYLNVANFRASTTKQVNLWLTGQNPGDGFDLEGGVNGVFDATYTAELTAAPRFIGAEDCTFRYATQTFGSGVGTAYSNCVTVESLNGLAYFRNCDASGAQTDGWNVHNTNGATKTMLLTENCTGNNNGRPFSYSCNGWTAHDTAIGIDVAGSYANNSGRTFHIIGASKALAIGTRAARSLGDLRSGGGGVGRPTEFCAADTAQLWCDRTSAETQPGSRSYYAEVNAQILLRNIWPSRIAPIAVGSAVIGTY